MDATIVLRTKTTALYLGMRLSPTARKVEALRADFARRPVSQTFLRLALQSHLCCEAGASLR